MRRTFERDLASLGYLVFEPKNKEKNLTMTLALFNHSLLSLGFYLDFSSNQIVKNASMKEIKMFYSHAFCLLKKTKNDYNKSIESYCDFPSLKNHSNDKVYLDKLCSFIDGNEEDYEAKINDLYKVMFGTRDSSIFPHAIHIVKEKEGIRILSDFYTSLFEKEEIVSPIHQERITLFMQTYPNKIKPQNFARRINLMLYTKILFKSEKSYSALLKSFPIEIFKTITDVLHFYAEYSNHHYLITHTFFHSLTRQARKVFLAILERLVKQNENVIDDFNRYKTQWKKAFKKLHVGDYAHLFPHVFKCAQNLRNDTYETTYKRIETAIASKDKAVFSILKKNPTIFRKKLDDLLRNSGFSYEEILEEFSQVIPYFSSLELIRLWEYYQNRNSLLPHERFVTYSKHGQYYFFSQIETRNPYENNVISSILALIEDGLKMHYAKRDIFYNVYLDEVTKQYALPLYELDAPLMKKHPSFGTAFSFQVTAPILRLFTRSIDAKKIRMVLDIHIYDENFRSLDDLMHDKRMKQKIHFFCPNSDKLLYDRTTFIDINFAWLKRICRYVSLMVHPKSCSCQFDEISECYAGFSFQNEIASEDNDYIPNDAVIYYPLVSKVTYTNAFVIDTKEQKVIWCDLASGLSNSEEYEDEVLAYIATKRHMTLFDLINMHQEHMHFVLNKNEAQYVIDDSDQSLIQPMDTVSVMEWIY